jgi:FtsX extracellular domain
MRICILTLLIITNFIFSCKAPECKINNLTGIKWQYLDSNTNYCICSDPGAGVNKEDSIEIEYLGVLKNDEKILIQRTADTVLFSILSQIYFGKFRVSEIPPQSLLLNFCSKLTRNSEAILQFDFSRRLPLFQPERKITVWFIGEPDSLAAMNAVLSRMPSGFYDSVNYISKAGAKKKWLADYKDSSWFSVLEQNPLPVSAEVFLKKEYYNFRTADSLKNIISNSEIISEVVFPTVLSFNIIKELAEPLKGKFYIRIKV